MGLFSEIHDRLGLADPDAAAAAMVADLKLSARQREALFPLILAECESIERARVRAVEQAVAPRVGRRVDPTGERAALLAETFALGDGSRVSWGEATVEQHEQRIAMLARLRDGIDATIARHRAAVEGIRAAGVKCLADLEALEVAA